MISYSITVAFCWDGITGEGVVDPGEICHGNRVNEDDEIKILIKKVHPADDHWNLEHGQSSQHLITFRKAQFISTCNWHNYKVMTAIFEESHE